MVNLTPVRLAYCAGLIDGEANADRTALQRDRVFLKRCDRFYLAMKRRVVSNNGVATRPL